MSQRGRGIIQALLVLFIQTFVISNKDVLLLKVVGPQINVFGNWLYNFVQFLIFIWPVIAIIVFLESLIAIISNKNLYQFFKHL